MSGLLERGRRICASMVASGPPIVEVTALGTAIASLHRNDPYRANELPKPKRVGSLDR